MNRYSVKVPAALWAAVQNRWGKAAPEIVRRELMRIRPAAPAALPRIQGASVSRAVFLTPQERALFPYGALGVAVRAALVAALWRPEQEGEAP